MYNVWWGRMNSNRKDIRNIYPKENEIRTVHNRCIKTDVSRNESDIFSVNGRRENWPKQISKNKRTGEKRCV